jgi:hypothetical protein
MTNFNIGTIQVDSPRAEMIIKTSSVDDIKTMFVSFLENDFITKPTKRKKGKWGSFADRMSGLTTPEITEHIENTSKEMRNSFEFRDLTPSN